MLANSKAFSGFAVDDLDKARQFYGETLGLNLETLDEEHGLMTLHLAGDRDTIVYLSPEMAPPSYTILNFPVDDIDQAVDDLSRPRRHLRAVRQPRPAPGRQGRDARRRPPDRLVQRPGREHAVGAAGPVGGSTNKARTARHLCASTA